MDCRDGLKVTLVGHDNYGSREIFSHILDSGSIGDCQLVVTEGLYYRKSFVRSVWKLLRESSFRFCVRRFLDLQAYKWQGDTLESRARRRGVPIVFSRDLNSPQTVGQIREFAPDLIVSLFTMHIFRSTVIGLPPLGTIGSHPSILPHYRGLEVFFWALANQEEKSGVSVFYLVPQIDMGKVILQEEFDIEDSETVESIYRKLTQITSRLMVDAIRGISAGLAFQEIPKVGRGSYFPMPTRDAYRRFAATGRSWQ